MIYRLNLIRAHVTNILTTGTGYFILFLYRIPMRKSRVSLPPEYKYFPRPDNPVHWLKMTWARKTLLHLVPRRLLFQTQVY